jgi:hypothetical protein
VELLAALVDAGVGVRVVVDSLERPLAVLELHLLVALGGNLLLAFPLLGRRAIAARLLLMPLMKLLRELLDLPALLHAVAPGVVYQSSWTALVAVGGLPWPLVATWAMTPPVAAATVVGALASGLLPPTFFFLFLFLPLL